MNISIVVPCYNEEEVLPHTKAKLLALIQSLTDKGEINSSSSVYFVDDGSRDRTWNMIEQWAQEDPRLHGLKLSGNKGHQNALLAGMASADGDAIVTVDADLQDDIGAIEAMITCYKEGCDIVYGVRNDRTSDTWFKRHTAQLYYRVLQLMGVKVVYNHADYRLLSRRALSCLHHYQEVNLFLRGIIPLLGFKTKIVTYARTERVAGESKYPIKKMMSLALEGVTSFSTMPLRMITLIGFTIFLVSFGLGFWALGVRVFTNLALPGWASTVIPSYFLGGIQLLCTGIIGEYLSKIYLEVKRRPRYFIEKEI